MWIDEADGFVEMFRGYLPYYLLVALPIFIIMSPVNPVAASHEFSVYRMQQYDLHTVHHGSRSSSFNLEGRSLGSWSSGRHCAVARLLELSVEQFLALRQRAGALLLVMPANDTQLTADEKEHIQLLELAMVQQETLAPVYFAPWSPELEDVLTDLQRGTVNSKPGTALEAILDNVASNGYQIVVSAPTPHALPSQPPTIHGRLLGRATSAHQTILIAAHMDSAGAVPELSFGADSNASGAVALLELARVFGRLYARPAGRGAPSLLFVLTSAGHSLNYFAVKKWIEEQIDSSDASLLQDVSFAMCLDSLSSAPALAMHVSKPPVAGGAASQIRSRLGVPYVHKKINLADEVLAWPHERFSIRRMTAFTLSALQSHKAPGRSSILDLPSEAHLANLVTNIRHTARALAAHIYNLTAETTEPSKEDLLLYDEALGISEASIRHWYEYLSSQPRAPQIHTVNAPNAGVTGALERALSRYMEVTVSQHSVDKREPEFTLYGPTRATLFVYSVKPAVFDLVLTLAIAAYLTLLYFAIQLFPVFYEEFARVVNGKAKVN